MKTSFYVGQKVFLIHDQAKAFHLTSVRNPYDNFGVMKVEDHQKPDVGRILSGKGNWFEVVFPDGKTRTYHKDELTANVLYNTLNDLKERIQNIAKDGKQRLVGKKDRTTLGYERDFVTRMVSTVVRLTRGNVNAMLYADKARAALEKGSRDIVVRNLDPGDKLSIPEAYREAMTYLSQAMEKL